MRGLCFIMALALGACGNNLDRETNIKDLRLLAMRADPPEIQFGSTEVFSGQPDASVPPEVTFSALVLDPRGGPVSYTWSFCPVETSESCLDFEEKRAQADYTDFAGDFLTDADFRDNLVDARIDGATGDALPSVEGDDLSQYAVPDFSVTNTLLADLGAYFALSNFYGFGMGAWPSAILHVKKGDLEVLAQKRLVVGLRNPAELNLFLGPALGVTFCTAPNDPEGCLDYTPVPNVNPVFALPFEVAFGQAAETPFVFWCRDPSEGTVTEPCSNTEGIPELKVGAFIRIRPRFTPESFQDYQVLKGDLQTRQMRVEDAAEDISVAWFTTAGNVSDSVTYPKFTRTLDTIYQAPAELPNTPNNVAEVWMVARDQRGGVAWESFRVRIVR